jgi:hypothetical protein
MSRTQFYDPQIGESAPMQIRGFQVAIGGTYVLMDDVITALREYAQSLEGSHDGATVHEAASWLQAGAGLPEVELPVTAAEDFAHGAEDDDVTLDVERVEIFPDAEGKWYARSIDTGGNIMKTTHGSFDKDWVTRNASERWVGIPIYEVATAMADSMWAERGHKGPSPKRLWGNP